MKSTAPFAKFEWMIAWRYIRAKRADGGVSVMTWISLIGVTLAVFALIATLAVRSGFRAEFIDTIVGANAHVSVVQPGSVITDYAAMADRIMTVEGVQSVSPLIRGQSMAEGTGQIALADIYGIRLDDLKQSDAIVQSERTIGDIEELPNGIALGSALAQSLGLSIGDKLIITTRSGTASPLGRSVRRNAYDVVFIFSTGRYQIDQVRAYLPFAEAQSIFNRDGVVDELEVRLDDINRSEELKQPIANAAGNGVWAYSWQDRVGRFLRALTIEDNVMFIILSILVLVASMNIISGLIMLVKNKGRDVGILRTMGLTEGSILRIFFICGAGIGTIGTFFGVVLGCLFAIYIDQIFSLVNYVAGGGVWDPSIRGIYNVPAQLHLSDVIKAMSLSLGLSWIITIFPARRAARMNPVEALRYE
ncbi:ABC transporter permease [Yoonia sediminilitoris]|uniref:Lipoprotein-releasing system permease protein n=1 Tax=Yoonia sediminilitoris TaxID=1286148 RepID=A0A2T6KQ52_9RHOB|nr:ABC transporter permease [Yoonia sediminilitoris]PUB18688.1 lipoprotein-releasing system permease protein [Yoonia sediminilitoris]RCW98856.1 lipoprotein-releasing system permease protein [Yoonia sediminilitoris]